jgi:hypothetical protein
VIGTGNCTNALFADTQSFDTFLFGGATIQNGQFGGRVAVSGNAKYDALLHVWHLWRLALTLLSLSHTLLHAV